MIQFVKTKKQMKHHALENYTYNKERDRETERDRDRETERGGGIGS